jgi:hypothetical protein
MALFNVKSISYAIRLQSKLLDIGRAVSNFNGTEIKILAGFGPVGNAEKKIGPIITKFCGQFFHVFKGQIKSELFYEIIHTPK